ncbi:aspartate/glutamate racemase family protein [Nonomuraea soli]|uniref:Hydantoin racemase n=1 Tax=Nonomuraea soli TaxID=1032476 RepID=A0A7W0HTI3_9ACTN|nr:aspartate/glutamate racemase family protein [Nonomuraea soli]MBA2895149.1 allantoin racemase [Nonomuraea soli]
MTLICVINPNTARSMTEAIGQAARAVAASGTTVVAVNPTMGPASIESHYDEALAVPGLLEQIALHPGADGFVVACFGDPGLDAARELAAAPVIGIAEAAMHTATLVGRSFSVVTTLSRTAGRALDLMHRYGFSQACLGIHACEIPVLDLESPGARKAVVQACRATMERDGCDSVVLGCAGMADFCHEISLEIGIPVIDGVTAAVKLAEGLAALGLRTSKRLEYGTPPAKKYTGLLSGYTRP